MTMISPVRRSDSLIFLSVSLLSLYGQLPSLSLFRIATGIYGFSFFLFFFLFLARVTSVFGSHGLRLYEIILYIIVTMG